MRPNSADVAAVLGRIYHLTDRPERAVQELQEAHRLAPDQPGHLLDLAEVLAALGRGSEARTAREEARRLEAARAASAAAGGEEGSVPP